MEECNLLAIVVIIRLVVCNPQRERGLLVRPDAVYPHHLSELLTCLGHSAIDMEDRRQTLTNDSIIEVVHDAVCLQISCSAD